MTQSVYVPLLDSVQGIVYPLVIGSLSLVKGLVVAAGVAFILVKLRGGKGSSRRTYAGPVALGLFLLVVGWSWVTAAEYTAVLVQPDGVELRYATWPRPSRRIAFDQMESVSTAVSGRRTSVHHLVITLKPDSPLGRRYWESAAGNAENIAAAIQWIEHASGGRVKRPPR